MDQEVPNLQKIDGLPWTGGLRNLNLTGNLNESADLISPDDYSFRRREGQ